MTVRCTHIIHTTSLNLQPLHVLSLFARWSHHNHSKNHSITAQSATHLPIPTSAAFVATERQTFFLPQLSRISTNFDTCLPATYRPNGYDTIRYDNDLHGKTDRQAVISAFSQSYHCSYFHKWKSLLPLGFCRIPKIVLRKFPRWRYNSRANRHSEACSNNSARKKVRKCSTLLCHLTPSVSRRKKQCWRVKSCFTAYWRSHSRLAKQESARRSIMLANFCGRGLVSWKNRLMKSLNHDPRHFWSSDVTTVTTKKMADDK